MALLPRLRDVSVAVVVGVPGSLILEVLFVVIRLVVLPTCRLSPSNRRSVIPQELVHQELLLNSINVHVSNWGKIGLGDLGSSDSSPVGLHSFHVPLIYYCYDVLCFQGPEIPEDTLVSEIDKDLLLLGGALAE